MTELKTERLLLRQWRDADLDPLGAMDADPEVMRFIGDGSTRDPRLAPQTLDRQRQRWKELGFGLFVVELRETGEFAGWIGLAVPEFLPEVLPAVEIGWRLPRAFWGRGIATEGARAVLEFGFVERGLDRVVSIRHVDNHASGRVMEKLGMRVDRRTAVPSHGKQVIVCALTRDEYLARVAPPR